jgi:hypothetical protein
VCTLVEIENRRMKTNRRKRKKVYKEEETMVLYLYD